MSKKDRASMIFWPTVGVVALSFVMSVYTAVTHPQKEGPSLVKPNQGESIPVPVTPDSAH